MSVKLPKWLAQLPSEDGFIHISDARRFAHDESHYDQQYSNDARNLTVGQGVVNLMRASSADFSSPALEIGCGTGLLSLGLIADCPYPLAIITDPSPAFLKIAQKKAAAAGITSGRACYAVLKGEEIDRIPDASLSLIVLRSTLHHVLDVEAFIRAASKVLVPDGVLTFQEPCTEGCLMMGAMIQFLPALAAAKGQPLSDAQRAIVENFANTMSFYSRRDLDKTTAEDKHLFRVDELMSIGGRCGLEVTFAANTSFEHNAINPRPPARMFSSSFRDYTRYCMSWDETMMAHFDRCIAPYTRLIDTASAGGTGPYFDGVFICRKVR